MFIPCLLTLVSLSSVVFGSHDSLAKCLYEEEIAKAQVQLFCSPISFFHDSVFRIPSGPRRTVTKKVVEL